MMPVDFACSAFAGVPTSALGLAAIFLTICRLDSRLSESVYALFNVHESELSLRTTNRHYLAVYNARRQ